MFIDLKAVDRPEQNGTQLNVTTKNQSVEDYQIISDLL